MKKRLKLFCLSYAGGSANIYNNWRLLLVKNMELCLIELTGRGSRIGEDYYENLDAAVNNIYHRIADEISKFDYAIFGHNKGVFFPIELTQKITSMGKRAPLHLFFSNGKPP